MRHSDRRRPRWRQARAVRPRAAPGWKGEGSRARRPGS